MEGEHLRGCRVYSGKQPSSSSSFSSFPAMKGSDLCFGGDVDTWEYFPCPFCYVDVEVPVLCSHLQEEHCFNTKNAVCPLCAANAGKDMVGHFSTHHSHMLKKRKPQKTNLQSSSATAENEPHGVNSYYGQFLTNSRRIASDPAPDPLLLSFIYNVPFPDNKDQVEESNSNVSSAALMPSHEKSNSLPSKCDVVRAQDYEERSCRAEFVQQLIFSTIFQF